MLFFRSDYIDIVKCLFQNIQTVGTFYIAIKIQIIAMFEIDI